uniref:Signal sequence receptor subunit alpha n=1 Tax=Caenorhabditis tropicalis TaxID=1561998 RepID=A0A1I7U765_9PELO
MENLKDVILHAHVEFRCNSTGPKVVIRNSSNLYLHHQILRQMRGAGAVLEDFDSDTDSYSEKVTLYLIGLSFLIVLFVEIIWALRRNLLFPNVFYSIFPMSINRKPKQKKAKKLKKTE